MLILSLGTNESYDPTFTIEGFRSLVDSMFTMIQSKLPNCAVIITLPSENYRVKNNIPIVNDRIEIITDILRKESTRFGYSIWDLKKAMGGDGSMLQWKEAGLVNKDYLHFLRKGYNLQGKLLFEAIHKELNAN
jgi:lysophospholipase L1-like esterase